MELDEQSINMDVEHPSDQTILDNIAVNYDPNIVSTLLSINHDSKLLKLNNDEDFILFKNKFEINTEECPNLFIFAISLPLLDEEKIKKINSKIETKFNDGRPIIVEFKSLASDERRIFSKESSQLVEHRVVENFGENFVDFQTFLAVLSNGQSGFMLTNSEEFLKRICALENSLIIKFLNIFQNDDNLKHQMCNLVIEQSDNVNFLEVLLDFPFNFNNTSKIPDKVITFLDSRGIDILKTAVEMNKSYFVCFLLSNFKPTFDSFDFESKQSVCKIASDKEFIDVLLFLIQQDFPHPENCSATIDEYYDDCHDFHQAIVDNNLAVVESFVDKYSLTKVAFDLSNQSALFKSFACEQWEMYAFLSCRGFKKGNHEETEVTESQNHEIEEALRIFTLRDPKKFARILTTKSRIHNHTNDFKKRKAIFKRVQGFFTDLSEIPEVNLLFKISANLLKTVTFDFNGRDISGMCPFHKKTYGVTYPSYIFIAAGQSTDDEIKDTIVHEFAHFAMRVVYENNFKPHFAHEIERENEFDEVIKASNAKFFTRDELVTKAFNYEEKYWSAELIVTVFVKIFHSRDDVNLLNDFLSNYSGLKTYYESVKNDLDNFDVDKRDFLRDLNREFCVSKKYSLKFETHSFEVSENQVLVTKIPLMTLSSVYQQLYEKYDTQAENLFLFADVEMILEDPAIAEKYFHAIDVYGDVTTVITLPEDFDEILLKVSLNLSAKKFAQILQIEENTTAEDLKAILFDNLLTSRFIVITASGDVCSHFNNNETDFSQNNASNSWEDLTSKSQEKILSNIAKFQGKFVKLSEIIVQRLNASQIFNETFLNLCLKKDTININSLTNFEGIHIDRRIIKKVKTSSEYPLSEEEYNVQDTINKYFKKGEKLTLISRNLEEKSCMVRKTKISKTEISEDDLLDQDLKYVLISDTAGSGKSQLLRRARDKLQLKFPYCWVYMVNLQQFLHDFNYAGNSINFEEFFIDKILKNKADYEKSIFSHSYKFSRVFILLDGFDEISPKCTKHVLSFIKSFNGIKGSQLWITTRVHLKVDLEKELEVDKIFSLCPFTTEDQINYLVRCWTELKLPGNLREIAKQLVERLSTVMTHQQSDLIGIPQQLEVIADTYVDNERFVENFLENLSKYFVYQKSIAKKIIEWRNRGPLSEEASLNAELNDSSFYSIYKFVAMKSYFENKSEFCGITRAAMWTDEEVIRCGIVKKFDSTSPIFQHETFKEVFVAIFVIQGLERSVDWRYFEELFQYFDEFLKKERFGVVRMFINDAIERISMSDEKLQKFANILSQKPSQIVYNTAVEDCNALLNFIVRILTKCNYEFVKQLINQDIHHNSRNYKLLMVLAKYEKLESIKILLNFSRNFLKNADFESMILFKYPLGGSGLLHVCPSLSFKFFAEYLKLLRQKCSIECFKALLTGRDSVGRTLIHYLAMASAPNLKTFWEILRELFTDEEFEEFIHQCDNTNMTIFHAAIVQENAKTFEFLMRKIPPNLDRFLIRTLSRYFNGKCALHMLACVKNLNFHEVFWKNLRKYYTRSQIERMIVQRDANANNFLHVLVSFADETIMEFTFRQIREIFDTEKEFKAFLSSKGYKSRMLLQKAADQARRNVDDQKYLWNYLRDLYEDDFREFFEFKDDNDDNVLHIIASFSNAVVLRKFIEFLESVLFLSPLEMKVYLMKNGLRDRNLLQNAAINNLNLDVHKLLWEIIEKYFPDSLSDFINHKEYFSCNLLHAAVAFSDHSICKYIWEKIKIILPTFALQKQYLSQRGFRSYNLYQNALEKNERYRDVIQWIKLLLIEYGINPEM